MAFQGEGERERQNLETPKAGELQDWSVVRPGTQAETPSPPQMGWWRRAVSKFLLPPSPVTARQHPLVTFAELQVDLLKLGLGLDPTVPVLALLSQFSHLQNGMVEDLPQRVSPQPGNGATHLSYLLQFPPIPHSL